MSPIRVEAINPVDEELNNLERDIRIFKIEYEQYFNGGRPRPPSDTEWRIEQVLKRYGERSMKVSMAQRFRFNNLAQTYAKFREVFRKRFKQREEGIVQRHYGAAAREIEAERAKRQRSSAPSATNAANVARAAEREAEVRVSLSDPLHELREVEKLYTEFRRALRKSGEATKPPAREQFLEFIQWKTDDLRKGKSGGEVEFAVVAEGGKTRLKARLKK
jgi:hypothetical protein